MSNDLDLFSGVEAATSPFDSIRQLRVDGTEFWSARDLVPLMGYTKWEHFQVPLMRAAKSAENQGHNVADNFRGSRKVAGQSGPAQEDNHLSRFAAYLVAMNGSPNKPEVAAAQAYFAVKTREAETAQRALTEDEIVQQALSIMTGRIAALTARNAELEPKADLADTYLTAQGGARLVREGAKLLGMREKDLRRFLLDEKLIFAKHAACGDVQYDHYAEFGHHFKANEHIVRHTWGNCSHYTLTILPRGMELIVKRRGQVSE